MLYDFGDPGPASLYRWRWRWLVAVVRRDAAGAVIARYYRRRAARPSC